MKQVVEPGRVYAVAYPFVRSTYEDFDEHLGAVTRPTWKPGVRAEYDVMVADGMGEMRLTVVGMYRPGTFPTRVFFTRRWTNHDGQEFGKNSLHILSLSAFRRRATTYGVEFELVTSVTAGVS